MNSGYQNPKQLIVELIENWPVEEWNKRPRDIAAKENLRERFQKYLSADFDIRNLYAQIDPATATVSEALITGKFAKVLIHLPLGPFLAVLKQGDNTEWRVSQFTFQCVTCFGVGVYGNEICNVCGGTGWGTLGDVEFCNGSI